MALTELVTPKLKFYTSIADVPLNTPFVFRKSSIWAKNVYVKVKGDGTQQGDIVNLSTKNAESFSVANGVEYAEVLITKAEIVPILA